MLIAQITDLHIKADGAANAARLKSVLARLARMRRQPDAIIATGDLTEHGTVQEYKALKAHYDAAAVSPLPCLGNHDVAANFADVFTDEDVFAEGFCQYARDLGAIRLVVADTHDESQHGGAFCEARQRWLDETLSAVPDQPTLIALHHPPMTTGIDWMDPQTPNPAWINGLREVVARHRHVKKVIAGHVHRPIERAFAHTSLCVAGATAAAVDLELAPVTSATADERPLIIEEPPGFALHWWDGEEFVSHHGVAGPFPVQHRYHDQFRDIMRDVFDVPE